MMWMDARPDPGSRCGGWGMGDEGVVVIEDEATYRSGLFCVSIMAARGIPKFDTGPQKSAKYWSVFLYQTLWS
jgi:hypothetical protein